jgi:hypothetical protein
VIGFHFAMLCVFAGGVPFCVFGEAESGLSTGRRYPSPRARRRRIPRGRIARRQVTRHRRPRDAL